MTSNNVRPYVCVCTPVECVGLEPKEKSAFFWASRSKQCHAQTMFMQTRICTFWLLTAQTSMCVEAGTGVS